ncbi:hypothetical protein HanLR1_Chr07g0252771 [Helianthus annuus]|nr:hypothetical protein HanHA89_Chr07g0270441 [Helianthus annuus]KAJ0729423.1 hypothetical protein HanLR1_Chr07g0252771 [Helianthus annuus]
MKRRLRMATIGLRWWRLEMRFNSPKLFLHIDSLFNLMIVVLVCFWNHEVLGLELKVNSH